MYPQRFKLDYAYGATNNNGNVQSQTITIPGGPTLSQTYTYDALNRIETAVELNGTNPSWKHVSTSLTYEYDAENRQTAYKYGQTTEATYAYDGEGRRVKKFVTASGVTTIFVYNALGQMVAEYSSAAAVANGTQYLTSDTLGTPRVVTLADGAVKSRLDYLSFGEELGAGVGGRTTQQGYSQFDGNRKKWATYERDDETGLDFAQARYYSSTMGRFTSPDEFNGGPVELFTTTASANPTFYAELADPQSLNKYQYTYNHPLNMVDPDGHCPDCPGLIIVTPETTRTAIDVLKGVRNALDNIAKDINNTNAAFGVAGATHDGSYREPENMAQAVGQVVTDRVLTLGGLLGGKSPAGVMTAEAKTTAIIAAESGALRATKES